MASPVLWSLLLTPVVYILYNVVTFVLATRKRLRVLDKFEGEPSHWLWGHLHVYPGPNERGLAYMRKLVEKYPKCSYMMWGATLPQLTTWHPETSASVLKSSEPKSIQLGGYKFGLPWLGDGLLLSQGSKWSRNRRLLTPAFHFDILKPYMKINNECADILLDKIETSAKTTESLEVFDLVSLYTFDVILRCAMSYVTDIQGQGTTHPYVMSVNRLGDLWINRLFNPWHHFDKLYWISQDGREFRKHCDSVLAYSGEVIRKRQESLTSGSGEQRSERYLDFLDILLKAKDADGKGLTFQEIRDEVDTFMFEGHDTTASAISWTLYSLAEHVDIQRRCQEEIDEILQGRDSDHITWDDLPKLKYLTQCIKEGMRLHCPVPFIGRALTKEMEIDGKLLPVGTFVDVQIYSLHHNPAVWKAHMEYRPSRFDPESPETTDSFAFVPFSAGPRNCIGQNFAMHEMKTVIARILRRFDIRLIPGVKVEKKIGVVMKTVDGMHMKMAPRT